MAKRDQNDYGILSLDEGRAQRAIFFRLQVATRSSMDALVYRYGGIVMNGG
ncbi:DUF2625 family protein [Campylobacter concisus]|uniref:DUF2625 family protein n=1 Tax=Campylobacter concisus TaxID=199 RepID=UPI001E3907E3|nr:DUF2625 family protein [Campylobacter concisus]